MKVALNPKKSTGKKVEISSITGKSINETYQSKELRQHIYDTPDTYVGSIDQSQEEMWVMNSETGLMEERSIKFVEGFYKIFDEILVNAIDHHHRINEKIKTNPKLKPVTCIRVDLDSEKGWISIENNGDGIEIAKNEKGDYIPEMLFGKLLTSINYDKSEQRTVGGKNGYGAKLANILSKKFKVETVDPARKLKFVQEYSDNMKVIGKPVITSYSRVPYTKISYLPDYERFGIAEFSTADDWMLLKRRVYDASACTTRNCKIYLNGERIETKEFEDYVNLYIGNKRETKRIYYKVNDRWEVCICLSPHGDFKQISFVNGIFTDRGGKHVNHIVDSLSRKIAEAINKKAKKGSIEIKPPTVKKNVWVFIKSTIVNPNFDTQTKRCLTTLVSKFGSRCDFDPDFVEQASKLGIAQRAVELAEFKAKKMLSSRTDGKRVKKVHHSKLIEAKFAATTRSRQAILVLTEGDSAANFFKSGIKGLTEKQRESWGCFPLRGKLLNVRSATLKQLEKNTEIGDIKKIVGLQEGVDYSNDANFNRLRYGKVMILADADDDGSHIQGLVINFIEYYWPELLHRDDFVCSFATPIIKAWPEKLGDEPDTDKITKFYSDKSYREWAETHTSGWRHEYYKGLGTHTASEARDCFKHMCITDYLWGKDEILQDGASVNASEYAVKMVFSKKFEDQRKQWIRNFDNEETEIPHNVPKQTIADFYNKKMIHFSISDVKRSIPDAIDGLKPSQRKVLYTMFKKNYKKKVKVIQLTGAMLEHAAYHHGDASANETIIKMANNYVGCTNMNLLQPLGIYGSRAHKGKDASQARYLGTNKTIYLNTLFNETDRILAKQQYDDGKPIEPEQYVPIIPCVLATGADGIGTGWSTYVPAYNVHDIVDNIRLKLDGHQMREMTPYYRGYNGNIIKTGDGKYLSVGNWTKISRNKIKVNELPVGGRLWRSFSDYKTYIQNLLEPADKKTKKDRDKDTASSRSGFGDDSVLDDIDITETSTDFKVVMTFKDGVLQKELATKESTENFQKKLKISVPVSTTNMNLIYQGKPKLYTSPLQIIDDFYTVRMEHYCKRKKYLLNQLEHKLNKNNAKYRFVLEIIEEKINIYRKKKAAIVSILDGTSESSAADPPYPMYTDKAVFGESDENQKPSYNYLLNMKIDSFSEEQLEKLQKEIQNLEDAIENLSAKTPADLWKDDLDEFIKLYDIDTQDWIKKNNIEIIPQRKTLDFTKSQITAKKPTVSIKSKSISKVVIKKNPTPPPDDDNMSVMSDLEVTESEVTETIKNRKNKLLLKKK